MRESRTLVAPSATRNYAMQVVVIPLEFGENRSAKSRHAIDRTPVVAPGWARGGEIALTGEFSGMAGFGGPVFTSAGFLDSFVAKYTAGGDHVWSYASGGPADDRGLGVAVDSTGAVYYTGSFHNMVSFGGDPLTASGTDFNGVLVKYSP